MNLHLYACVLCKDMVKELSHTLEIREALSKPGCIYIYTGINNILYSTIIPVYKKIVDVLMCDFGKKTGEAKKLSLSR